MVNLRNKNKDSIPYYTIKGISDILHNVGIETFEQHWEDVSSKCFSVRVEIDGFPGVGTNGKGTTRFFALASAYGELMERLQNKKLLNKTYGLKYSFQSFSDEKPMDMVKFSTEYPKIMKHLVGDYKNEIFFKLLNKYPKLSYFSMFYDVFEDKEQLLPSVLINMACGTNGMCAGNSPYEALSHGICEIMERYVSKQILFHQLTLPEIPIEEIDDQKIIEIINLLKNAGLDVIIKDCTLRGVYPVVGVLVINKSKTKYQFKLGSESIFSIALERCLSEMFQGRDIQSFVHDSMLPIQYNFTNDDKKIRENLTKISINSTGQFPISIFFHDKPDNNYKNAFLSELENNKQSYEHLLRQLKKNDFKLFIRNLSFLNFPTYKIYIPGMSEVFINDTDKIERRIKINCVANYLLNIKSCNREELEFLLEEIEIYSIQNPEIYYLERSPFFKSTNLHLTETNDFGKLDLRLITALLAYILGKDKKAANYFTLYIKTLSDRSYANLNYYRCIMAFFQLKADSIDDENIPLKLIQFFPESTVSEVLEDFKERSSKLFSDMPLPSCPDCNHCKILNSCLWKEWERKNTTLNEKLNAFNNYHVI